MRMVIPPRGDTFCVRAHTQMSNDDDVILIEAAKRGERRAREHLVENHLHDIRSVAFAYRGLGLPFDDLVQEGSLGLLEAIDLYDAERGADFDTYARFRARRAIRNALTEKSRVIRLPKQVVERRRAIERAEAQLAAAGGHSPTTHEVATALGLTDSAVLETRDLSGVPISLDQSLLPDGSPLEAIVADDATDDPAIE